ncbi:YggT family protein [Polycladidibacter hongkongensis]|uniref:YggT family protein n=1 Tax=Polycladidibacter hongkongensis TaxID=1647556 RepID=UPI00082A005C|nr:YggT family protein [Pseudovibrio hongkongensis]
MRAVLDIIMIALNLYYWVIIASAIFSWLYAFNVVNPGNQVVATIGRALYSLTEPLLRPIRRYMPNIGGLDLSPIVLLLGVIFVQIVISRYAYPLMPF